MDRSRIILLMAALVLPLGGLQARLVQLQLVDPSDYTGNLQTKKASVHVTRAPRGRIVDRNGVVLAEDRRSFDAYLVLDEYEKAPGPIPGVPAGEIQESIERIYEKIERQVNRRPAAERRRLYLRERRTPYLLRRDIPFEAAVAIETSPQLAPGAVVREALKRFYPYEPRPSHRQIYGGAMPGVHAIGYLGRATANEQEFRDRLQDGTFWPGFEDFIGQDGVAQLYRRGEWNDELIGKAGVERRYDDDLRAKPGLVIEERQAGTSAKNLIELKPAERGSDVELTIDIRLQEDIEEIVAGPLHVATVVMDAKTGAIPALVSNRLYNPNDFVPPGNPDGVKRAIEDTDGQPLASRTMRHYPLGSVFKVVTSVAGLEEKKVTPAELLPCRGKFLEHSKWFACHIWNNFHMMHGELPLHEALEKSCNCYYYEVGRRVGLPDLARWAQALGYGAATGLDVPGEAPGRLPARARGENDVLNLAIGQGEGLFSPIQVAVMMAAIANGGERVTPHVRRNAAFETRPVGISKATIEAVRKGLYDVVHSPHGTAHSSGLAEFDACGKTSTAQAGGDRNHAWFAGYAPSTAPRWVVVVFVEYGGHGGETAAPLAARILASLKKRE